MDYFSCLLLCALLTVPQLSSGEEFVKVLTKNNFNEILNRDAYTLVLFCTPYSPQCRDAAPEVKEAALRVAEIDKSKIFATLDCDADETKDICKQQKVAIFPALRLFYKGKIVQDYDASIEQDTLVKYMKKPPKLGGSNNLDEEDEAMVNEKDEQDDVADFQMKNVKNLDVYSFATYTKKHANVIVFFYVPFSAGCKKVKQYIEDAVSHLKHQRQGQVYIAAVNCENEDSAGICNVQKVEKFPRLRVFKKGSAVGDFTDPITSTEVIMKFIDSKAPATSQKDKGDNTTPEFPKESVKDTDDELPITKLDLSKGTVYLSDSNFTNFVKKPRLHTLVMFYAEWCSHCQEILPSYKHAAAMVADNYRTRVLAVMNCALAENEKTCTQENVDKYPTFIRYLNGAKVEEYNGGTSGDDFFDYIVNDGSKKAGEKSKTQDPDLEDDEPELEKDNAPSDPKSSDKEVSNDKVISKEETEEAEKMEDRMKGVPYLESENFHSFITTPGQRTVVMFYAHWCSFCLAAKPLYQKAASIIAAKGRSDLQFAAINCVDKPGNEQLCEDLKIEGYPTFLRYANGQRIDELNAEQDMTVKLFTDFITSDVKIAGGQPVQSPKDEL